MERAKKLLAAGIAIGAVVFSLSFGFMFTAHADATCMTAEQKAANVGDGDVAEPNGWYTKLSLSLCGNNGEVWAEVKNEFTLFPASVIVYVYLYSSDTYQDSYTNMTLENRNYISDLNIGKTVEARVSTNGEQKYWKARAYYNVDNKGWKNQVTDTLLLDAQGLPL